MPYLSIQFLLMSNKLPVEMCANFVYCFCLWDGLLTEFF